MTLNLKTTNQSFAWHFGPWCCVTTPSLVTEGSAAEEILSRWTFTGILNLFCDLKLDHNKDIQSFHKTIHLMFSCKRFRSSDNILKCHILIILSLTVTLTSKTANQSFWKTIWLITMHHHTKFGRKRLSSWWDIIQMNIGILNPFCDLDLDHKRAIQSFHKTIHLIQMCHQTQD